MGSRVPSALLIGLLGLAFACSGSKGQNEGDSATEEGTSTEGVHSKQQPKGSKSGGSGGGVTPIVTDPDDESDDDATTGTGDDTGDDTGDGTGDDGEGDPPPDTTPPTVSAGADATIVGSTLTRTGTAADDSGSVTVVWSKVSGPGNVLFSDSANIVTDISVDAEGEYVLALTALDAAGNQGSAQFTLTRVPPTPVVTAGADFVAGAARALDGGIDDASGVVLTWSKVSGPGVASFDDDAVLAAAFSADADGTYVLRLTGDRRGAIAHDDVSVTWDTTAPTVDAGSAVSASGSMALAGSATDATSLTKIWTQQSGPGTCNFSDASLLNAAVTCDLDGAYTLRLTATDSAGNAASDDVSLAWDSHAPSVDAGADQMDVVAAVAVNATVTDFSSVVLSWSKVSGPGTVTFSSASAEDPTVSVSQDGLYVLRLTATDSFGNTASDTLTLEWIKFSADINFASGSGFDFDPDHVSLTNGVVSLGANSVFETFDSQAEFEAAGSSSSNVVWDADLSAMALNAAGLVAKTGSYTSQVVDLGAPTDVKTLIWDNPVPPPYQRNLPGNGAGDPADWGPDRITEMTDLVMLFHFNEDAGSTHLVDSSGNLASGSPMAADCVGSGCALLNYRGRIGRGAEFDGNSDSFTIPDSPANRIDGSLSIAVWMKVENANFNYIIEKGDSDACDNYALYMYNGQAGFEMSQGGSGIPACNGSWAGWNETAPALATGTWYHIAVVYDDDAHSVTFYRNGVVSGQFTGISETITPSDMPVRIGRQWWGGTEANVGYFQGGMDELAVWRRALGSDEIGKFYRRGLYRLDLQVRGCTDVACNTSTGWLGPDGGTNSAFYTYFLPNNDPVGALPVLGVDSRRYFQFRATYTAPDSATSPLLASVGASAFDTTNPTVTQTESTRSFTTITGFSELVDSDHIGDVKYQISADGVAWYYYNGSAWAVASAGFAHTSTAAQINTNAATIASGVGTGSFYFKAFLNRNPGSGFIRLRGVRVVGTKQY